MAKPSGRTEPSRLRALFEAALDQPAETRGDWIAAHANDAAERALLERLIAAENEPCVLDMPAAELAARIGVDEEAPAESLIGQRIGQFRLVRMLGQGGMAAVFLGEREDADFTQQVAVKLLRRGLYSEVEQRLFRRERQTLARLSHPNIAHLLDGGVTEAGIPYLVMEYVDGVSITKYVTEHRLDLVARLRLFLAVCRAVDAAHHQMIVHRDLKPSNILVDARGEVKLLDFGIAKLLEDETGAVQTEVAALTPEYAAPEQYSGGPISMATDVYALGVVLHELLLGVRPEAGGLRRPSAWIADASTDASTVPLSKPVLRAALRGDLDNVILKALAGETERRYASAGAFGEDIECYLDGRPITAHPPTWWYVTRKFVQRHRAGVIVAALFVVGLIASLGVVSWQAGIARQQAHRAEAEQRRTEDARNELVLQNAELRMRRDPTAAAAALRDYRGPDATRSRRLLAEANGRGVAIAEFSPHRGYVMFLAGEKAGAFLSLATDHRICMTDKTGTTTLAADASADEWSYAPNKRLLAYSRTPSGIGVLDLATRTVTGIDIPIALNGLALSPDGSRLAALDHNRHLTVWRLAPFEVLFQLDLPNAQDLKFASASKLVVLEKSAVRTFDVDREDSKLHAISVTANTFDTRNDTTIVADTTGQLVWFTAERASIVRLPVCKSPVNKVEIAARAPRAAFGCQDGTAGIVSFDLQTGTMAIVGSLQYGEPAVASLDSRGEHIAVVGSTAVYLYDTITQIITTFEGQSALTVSVAQAVDGEQSIHVGDNVGNVRTWRLPLRASRVIAQGSDNIYSFALSPDARTVISNDMDGGIHWVDVENEAVTRMKGAAEIYRIRFSRDGKSFMSPSVADARVLIVVSGGIIRSYKSPVGSISDVEYADVADNVISVGADGRLTMWSLDGRSVKVLFKHGSALERLEVLRNNQHAIVRDNTGAVWDISQEGVATRVRVPSPATGIRPSIDGRLLAVATAAGSVLVYDTSNYRLIQELQTHEPILEIAIDPGNRDLVIATRLGNVHAMSLDGTRVLPIKDIPLAHSVAYSPDGDTVAIVRLDGSAWFYAMGGNTWTYVRDHTVRVYAGRFLPDGKRFATMDQRGTVVVRDLH